MNETNELDPEIIKWLETPTVIDPAKAQGWHHTIDSDYAHLFTNGYPWCQESDVGYILDLNDSERLLGALCEGCRRIFKARFTHHVIMNKRRREGHD